MAYQTFFGENDFDGEKLFSHIYDQCLLKTFKSLRFSFAGCKKKQYWPKMD